MIVVNASAVTPNNTGGGIHFDATPDVFDIDVYVITNSALPTSQMHTA